MDSSQQVTVVEADLDDPALIAFLEEHLRDLAPTAPPESRHALDLDGLRGPGVQVWSAHLTEATAAAVGGPVKGTVVGTVAIAALANQPGHAELKSMRVSPAIRGRGVGWLLLEWALDAARAQGYSRVSLETGAMDFFAPARALYQRRGFVACEPFGDYAPDPLSRFFTLAI